ncbi:hypothetical protein COOONC_11045 [Cooperia oncophora]
MPKDSVIDKPALKSLQKLEEEKLDNIADLAAKGKDKEAAHLLVEMKKERKEQEILLKKQEEIVQELQKHVEEKVKAKESGEKVEEKVMPEAKRDVEKSKESLKMVEKAENKPEVVNAERNATQKFPATVQEKELSTKSIDSPANVNRARDVQNRSRKASIEHREA